MASKNITVTRNRGIKALENLVKDIDLNNKDSDKKIDKLKLKLGEVLKFYPGSDKVLVKFMDNTQKRCLILHTVVSNEINISWTPVGYHILDDEYNEPAIVPLNKFNALVLSLDGFNEDCVIGYISKDTQDIVPNANSGELLLQYYDTSIKLMQDGIVVNSEKIIINGLPLDVYVSESVGKQNYTHEEINTMVNNLDERIKTLEDDE